MKIPIEIILFIAICFTRCTNDQVDQKASKIKSLEKSKVERESLSMSTETIKKDTLEPEYLEKIKVHMREDTAYVNHDRFDYIFYKVKGSIQSEKFPKLVNKNSYYFFSEVYLKNNKGEYQDTLFFNKLDFYTGEEDTTIFQDGVLKSPVVKLGENQLIIGYSLSIPKTDIGVPVNYVYDFKLKQESFKFHL